MPAGITDRAGSKRYARILFFSVLLSVCRAVYPADSTASAGSWIIAASALEHTALGQTAADPAVTAAGATIPQLLLEYLSSNAARIVSDEEIIIRRKYALYTKRQSFFSDLTKQVHARDALLFSNLSGRSLREKQQEADEKIAAAEEHIRESLAEEQELEPQFKKEKNAPDYAPVSEKIALWKDDSSRLFSVAAALPGTAAYEKAVTNEKIRGLVTGTMQSYGNFISVSVELRQYPGGVLIGTASDTGSLHDIDGIVRNLSAQLSGGIFNTPVTQLHIAIDPPEAGQAALTAIGDRIFKGGAVSAIVQEGIQSVRIDAPGFETVAFSYNYVRQQDFYISVTMRPVLQMPVYIGSTGDAAGTLYLNAEKNGAIPARVLIDNKPYIGEIVSEDGYATYFLIDPSARFRSLSDGGSTVYTVNPLKENVSDTINRNRRKMYTAYGALLVSLPFFFYSYGRYESMVNTHNAGISLDVQEINAWRTGSAVAAGVAIVSGCYMVYRLCRYIYSAEKVLPRKVTAETVSAEQAEEMEILSAAHNAPEEQDE